MKFLRRKYLAGKVNKQVYEAGLYCTQVVYGCGYELSFELKDFVQNSKDQHSLDKMMISRISYGKQLIAIKNITGITGWDCIETYVINEQLIRGRFLNELVKVSLQAVYDNCYLPIK